MKFRCFIVSAALLLLYPAAACGQAGYTFVLTGASFASPSNTWFETGCERIGATPINRAIGAVHFIHREDDARRYVVFQGRT